MAEQVARIVVVLDLNQPIVVIAVRRANPVLALIAQIVDIDATRRVWTHR